jgi:hypothetical protein
MLSTAVLPYALGSANSCTPAHTISKAQTPLYSLLDNSETQIDHFHPGGDPGSSMCEAPLGLVFEV